MSDVQSYQGHHLPLFYTLLYHAMYNTIKN